MSDWGAEEMKGEGVRGGYRNTSGDGISRVVFGRIGTMNKYLWDDTGVVVVSGMPTADDDPDETATLYPATTLVVVKTLRQQGISVRVATEDVREVSYHAAEEWLPVLHFGVDLLVGAGGNLLASLIMKLLDSGHSVRAHIKWRVKTSDGVIHTFKYDGDRRGAIQAAELFERNLNLGSAKAEPSDES